MCTEKPAGIRQFIFSLFYLTFESVCTFTPANTRAPVDALETQMPKAPDSWIAGLAQTSEEADASRGGGGEIDSYCISGHGANIPHQRQYDTLNTSNAPFANPTGRKTTPKPLIGSRRTSNTHICTELTEPEVDGKQR